ncbi:hypothetical protein LCGC14_2234870 [marine sediment metagenome]|uniref:Tail assembly chaperone n=1 Tax=marine sediment metagenome TaxID=412755 RepID=A0A0F9G256_9ZZZZ
MDISQYFVNSQNWEVLEFPRHKNAEGDALRIAIRLIDGDEYVEMQAAEGEDPKAVLERMIRAVACDPDTGERLFPDGSGPALKALKADVTTAVVFSVTAMISEFSEEKKKSKKPRRSG